MKAKQFQQQIGPLLKKHFGQTVILEWPISRGATDALAPDHIRYSPRVDIAVNTVGMASGNRQLDLEKFWQKRSPKKLKNVTRNLWRNNNPRCSLAIEIVFSGSSKHILGDITNASMMGLYGIVVPSTRMDAKVRRIFEYIKVIKNLGKAPEDLFRNVIIIPQNDFIKLIT